MTVQQFLWLVPGFVIAVAVGAKLYFHFSRPAGDARKQGHSRI